VSAEAKESPLLEAVTRKRLVKTLQAGEDLVLAAVICEVWRLAVALLLLVLPSRVYKWSIYPISNPNPVYSHTRTIRDSIKATGGEKRETLPLIRHKCELRCQSTG
jgi:hypothetical protein